MITLEMKDRHGRTFEYREYESETDAIRTADMMVRNKNCSKAQVLGEWGETIYSTD